MSKPTKYLMSLVTEESVRGNVVREVANKYSEFLKYKNLWAHATTDAQRGFTRRAMMALYIDVDRMANEWPSMRSVVEKIDQWLKSHHEKCA